MGKDLWKQYDADQMYENIYRAAFASNPRMERIDPSWYESVDARGVPTRIHIGADAQWYNNDLGQHNPEEE